MDVLHGCEGESIGFLVDAYNQQSKKKDSEQKKEDKGDVEEEEKRAMLLGPSSFHSVALASEMSLLLKRSWMTWSRLPLLKLSKFLHCGSYDSQFV